MSSKCSCIFCIETYPALKRMKTYLKPEDYQAVENLIEQNLIHKDAFDLQQQKLREAEAQIDDLKRLINS